MGIFNIRKKEMGSDGCSMYLLAEAPIEGILGSAFAGLEGETVRLDSIQANPPVRGRGVGSALLTEVLEWGKERGAKTITGKFIPDPFSRPEDVEKFYNKFGITVDENGNLYGKI